MPLLLLPARRLSRLDPVLDAGPSAGVLRCRACGAGADLSPSMLQCARRACKGPPQTSERPALVKEYVFSRSGPGARAGR